MSRPEPAEVSLGQRILDVVSAGHEAEPWALGVTSLAISRRLELPEADVLAELARLADDGRVHRRFGYFAEPGHAVALSAEQRAFFEPLLPPEGDESASPVAYEILVASIRAGRIAGIAKALDTLLATGALIRVGEDCFRGSQMAAMRRSIEAHFDRHDRLTVAEFRDIVGTTRKHAVPLLEWFDRAGVTRRDGVDRVSGAIPT
ncbi:MAG TPA: SelB C-terminal domain-containing protein [Candidatus Tumulicola sp.]